MTAIRIAAALLALAAVRQDAPKPSAAQAQPIIPLAASSIVENADPFVTRHRGALETSAVGRFDDPFIERLHAVPDEVRQVKPAEHLLGVDLHVIFLQ